MWVDGIDWAILFIYTCPQSMKDPITHILFIFIY